MRSDAPSTTRTRGFTLIELIIALSIVSILTALAAPGTRSLMARAATQSQARGLMAAVELARSEAIARGGPVSVCAANAARTACGSTWGNGWIVFSDAVPLGTVDAGDTIVRAFGAVSSPYQVVNSPSTSRLTFAATGDFVGNGIGSVARWTFTHTSVDPASAGKAVCINLGTGRARMLDAAQACASS